MGTTNVPAKPAGWSPGRVLVGLVLIGVGVLVALDQAGVLEAGGIIGAWWPVIIVGAGLLQLTAVPRSTVGAGITILVGAVLLGFTTGVLTSEFGRYAWPLLLVAAGVWILVTRVGVSGAGAGAPDTRINAWALFSGRDIASHARPLRYAALTALFGGVNLDLRDAEAPAEGILIDATAAFGGVEVRVPAGWRVEMTGPALFGAYEDKTHGALSEAPLVRVHCLVLFGGTEVKN